MQERQPFYRAVYDRATGRIRRLVGMVRADQPRQPMEDLTAEGISSNEILGGQHEHVGEGELRRQLDEHEQGHRRNRWWVPAALGIIALIAAGGTAYAAYTSVGGREEEQTPVVMPTPTSSEAAGTPEPTPEATPTLMFTPTSPKATPTAIFEQTPTSVVPKVTAEPEATPTGVAKPEATVEDRFFRTKNLIRLTEIFKDRGAEVWIKATGSKWDKIFIDPNNQQLLMQTVEDSEGKLHQVVAGILVKAKNLEVNFPAVVGMPWEAGTDSNAVCIPGEEEKRSKLCTNGVFNGVLGFYPDGSDRVDMVTAVESSRS